MLRTDVPILLFIVVVFTILMSRLVPADKPAGYVHARRKGALEWQ
jgi:hypothetical protein